MKLSAKGYKYTDQFLDLLSSLPSDIQDLFMRKVRIFIDNIYHPSFRTKKIRGLRDRIIWEGSLTEDYRFTFQIEDGIIIFRNIGKHSIIDRRKF